MVLSKTIILLLLLYIENPQNILKTKNIGQFLENRVRIKYYFCLLQLEMRIIKSVFLLRRSFIEPADPAGPRHLSVVLLYSSLQQLTGVVTDSGGGCSSEPGRQSSIVWSWRVGATWPSAVWRAKWAERACGRHFVCGRGRPPLVYD